MKKMLTQSIRWGRVTGCGCDLYNQCRNFSSICSLPLDISWLEGHIKDGKVLTFLLYAFQTIYVKSPE